MSDKPIEAAVVPDWLWPVCDHDFVPDLEGCGYCRHIESLAGFVPEWGLE